MRPAVLGISLFLILLSRNTSCKPAQDDFRVNRNSAANFILNRSPNVERSRMSRQNVRITPTPEFDDVVVIGGGRPDVEYLEPRPHERDPYDDLPVTYPPKGGGSPGFISALFSGSSAGLQKAKGLGGFVFNLLGGSSKPAGTGDSDEDGAGGGGSDSGTFFASLISSLLGGSSG